MELQSDELCDLEVSYFFRHCLEVYQIISRKNIFITPPYRNAEHNLDGLSVYLSNSNVLLTPLCLYNMENFKLNRMWL